MQKGKLRALLAMGIIMSATSVAAASVQDHFLWSLGDTGAPDCPQQYASYGEAAVQCLIIGTGGGTGVGNRSCLMGLASQAASQNNCAMAFQMFMTTQCHNSEAQSQIMSAGIQNVCSMFRGN